MEYEQVVQKVTDLKQQKGTTEYNLAVFDLLLNPKEFRKLNALNENLGSTNVVLSFFSGLQLARLTKSEKDAAKYIAAWETISSLVDLAQESKEVLQKLR